MNLAGIDRDDVAGAGRYLSTAGGGELASGLHQTDAEFLMGVARKGVGAVRQNGPQTGPGDVHDPETAPATPSLNLRWP